MIHNLLAIDGNSCLSTRCPYSIMLFDNIVYYHGHIGFADIWLKLI